MIAAVLRQPLRPKLILASHYGALYDRYHELARHRRRLPLAVCSRLQSLLCSSHPVPLHSGLMQAQHCSVICLKEEEACFQRSTEGSKRDEERKSMFARI